MEYVEIGELVRRDGLRIVLAPGVPSPWGQAARSMMDYKGLDYSLGAFRLDDENEELGAWSGTRSVPVVAWNDEAPVNRWDDILLLLERLAPEKPLVPEAPAQRAQVFGLAHSICAPQGFGWNRRLDGIHLAVQSGLPVGAFGAKYGYSAAEAPRAVARGVAFMGYLADLLESQARLGSGFIVGNAVTAADFYWAAFSIAVVLPSPDVCPLEPMIRTMYEPISPALAAAVDPILIEHRDRIMRAYFELPLEL